MNISKFLFIDIGFFISILSLLFLIQGGKIKSRDLRNANKEALFGKTSVKLPDKEMLIKLEKASKNEGSGIEFKSISGEWRFVSVWKKVLDEEDPIFTSLLRVFAAKIEFKEDTSVKYSPEFPITVSIQFGLFTIEFLGFGCLKGKQPILTFFFNLIQLKTGSKTLLSKCLKESEEKKKSFFALIALEESSSWLSARVQSGAMVIWLKN